MTLGGPVHGQPAAPATATDPVRELQALHESRDYFSLERRLKSYRGEITPEIRFLQAAVLTAFNQPRRSNQHFDALNGNEPPSPALQQQIHLLRLRNYLRLHEYRAAFDAGTDAAALGRYHSAAKAVPDVLNTLKMLRVLRDVEPQMVEIGDTTTLTGIHGRYPVRFIDQTRLYILDTGANYSVLMRSEAEALGLTIREAGLEVGTSTDVKVTADIAVAPAMSIGNVEYRNVVFLVFADALLTIDENTRLDGIIGFPVLEAMREIRFEADGSIIIPAEAPRRNQRNLALEELMPLVRVEFRGEPLIGQFDTGANRTQAYEPFYQRFRERIEAEGERHETKTAGVGGIRMIPAYRLPTLEFNLAGRTIELEDVDVLTESITSDKDNYFDLNIGLDALEPFNSYIINFRDMALILE